MFINNKYIYIGEKLGHPELILLVCALSSSAACAMPMTSFPNMLTLTAEDDFGHHFLKVTFYNHYIYNNNSILLYILYF